MDFSVVLELVPAFFSAICAALMAWFNARMKKRDKLLEKEEEAREREEQARKAENEAIREGMQAILRDRMIQMYEYCESRQFAPIYMVENMNHMYKAYHVLGGNGAMVTLYDKFKTFPHSRECAEDLQH